MWLQCSQNSVSLVGRMHSRSGSSSLPPTVTHAHSGAKPSTWSFSFCSRLSGDQQGHGDVLVSRRLELPVQLGLDIFPDGIAVGPA